VLVALNLYCQLPFGKLHQHNPLIIATAALLGRTPSALAMKLTNLASLDPHITSSGRVGLPGASALDRQVWGQFQAQPEAIAYESQTLVDALAQDHAALAPLSSQSEADAVLPSYYAANTSATVQVRVKQAFFRKAVLSSYEHRCCMTGLADARLLVASHIVPWSKDEQQRLNPANGLCLSALHDKAFDRGLLTVTPDYQIKVSPQLKATPASPLAHDYLLALDGRNITLPHKFAPLQAFLEFHSKAVFLG
jgi:hypothetical protein